MASLYPALLMMAVILGFGAVIARRSLFYSRQLTPRSNARYESLDGLRGFLALGVIVHHGMATYSRVTTGGWEVGTSPTAMLLGTGAVAMFFMITGFLFWRKMLADGERFNVRHHFRGRVTRLAPMYLFVATLALIVTVVSCWPVQTSGTKLVWLFTSIYAMGITKWSTIHGFDPGNIVAGVTWTLRYEWLFYGVLPLMVAIRKTRWIVLMTVGYVGYFALTTHGWMHKPFGPSVNLLGGMIAAQLQHAGAFAKFNWRSRWVSLAGFALLIALPTALTKLPMAVFPMTLAMFFMAVRGNTFFGLLTASGPKMVGTVSYSVYLLHGVVLYLARPLLHSVAMTHSAAYYWLALTGVGLLTVATSALTFRWIEEPFIQLERERRRANKAITPAYAKSPAPVLVGTLLG